MGTMSGYMLGPSLYEKAQVKKMEIDDRLADAEAIIAEEWRQIEENGRQEKMCQDILESKRAQEAEAQARADAHAHLLAQVTHEEEQKKLYHERVEAEIATQKAAQEAYAEASAEAEKLEAAYQASATQAMADNHDMSRELNSLGRTHQLMQEQVYAGQTSAHAHVRQQHSQAQAQALQGQEFLQMHETRQAEHKAYTYDATLQEKYRQEEMERASRMYEQQQQAMYRAQNSAVKQDSEDRRQTMRMNPGYGVVPQHYQQPGQYYQQPSQYQIYQQPAAEYQQALFKSVASP